MTSASSSAVRESARPGIPLHDDPLSLYWLPYETGWSSATKALDEEQDPKAVWERLVGLAGTRLDLARTARIDRTAQRRFGGAPPANLPTKPIRLAVLGSSTLGHLLPGIRVGGLRRGLWITAYEGDYGQYSAELADRGSGLYAFAPTVILLALDAYHATRGVDAGADADAVRSASRKLIDSLTHCWRLAREAGIPVVQQTVLPTFPPILGNNEHRLPGSKARFIARFNETLRECAEREGVDLLAVDAFANARGLGAWHNPVLWHRAKQEVSPAAAQLYGDHLARLLAARQGRSSKCLVLDLDNTLWGGVIGDDGLDGIVLGQGSAMGEAFLDLQAYALEQAKRGVILAVCSKNDEANALAPFERHPDMLLKRGDVACFVANWDDKAKNIRRIARELNIGLDSLVFVDDNPFERNLVRSVLPMVAVPEIPEDPALVARSIADAGYFEGVGITDEDRERTLQYQANAERAALEAEAADLPSYLESLRMEVVWKEFDAIGLQRITQLINKTNQFNLTTRRYNEDQVRSLISAPDAFGLQLRLIDRFGDNGVIAIVIGRLSGEAASIDTWLMSCRVLGRQVEEATLNLVVEAAARLGAKRLIGEYLPTAKNGMVKEHYRKLGFIPAEAETDGSTRWTLPVADFQPAQLYMSMRRG